MRNAAARKILGAEPEIVCRGCGCTDSNACVTELGPCAWFILDFEVVYGAAGIQRARPLPTGICSACAVEVDFDPRVFMILGREHLLPERQPSLVLP